MPLLFIYFLKLSVALSVEYFFYVIALRRLTFYNWNRWYLLIYTALCFLFPLIDTSSIFSSEEHGSNNVIYLIPTLSDINKHSIVNDAHADVFTIWKVAAIILISGMVFLSGRLVVQLYSYRNMVRKAPLISDERIRIYQTDLSNVPFSFGRSVFINPNQHTEEELEEIIKHEFVHVKQMHTIDVIWGEILCIVNWFNPFAWMIRNDMRQNLEFIADDKVLQEGIDKKEYQYLLLKVTGNKNYSIAHSFNFSSLKKRIAMMNKSKTAKLQLMRFLFLLPVVVILLLVFRKEGNAQKKTEKISVDDTVATESVNEVTLVPLPPGLLNYKQDVKDVFIKGDVITVFLQNGNKEIYNLHDKQQKAALEKKYGKMPEVPVVADTISTNPVREVILEPNATANTEDAEVQKYLRQELEKRIALIQNSNKSKQDTVPSKPAPPAKASKVSSPSSPAKVSKESSLSIVGEVSISLKGGDNKPISYSTTDENPESLDINKAIVTAESISFNSKNHSLNLKGDASFKNDQGVKAYAATIELSLKKLSSFPYVLIDNKELEWDKDYSSNYKQTYEVSFLKKEDATRKYGDKAKEGALEITSL